MRGEGKRLMRRRLEIQDDIIKTLEEQVILMGDVVKIKDLTIQSLVGALSMKVPPEEIESFISGSGRTPGQYL